MFLPFLDKGHKIPLYNGFIVCPEMQKCKVGLYQKNICLFLAALCISPTTRPQKNTLKGWAMGGGMDAGFDYQKGVAAYPTAASNTVAFNLQKNG